MKIKFALVALLLCTTQLALAQVVATVTHLSGLLSVDRADGSRKVLALKSEVLQGDLLSTAPDTYARIKFKDDSEVVLRPGTQLRVDKVSYDAAKPEADALSLSLVKGGLRAISGLIGKRSKQSVQYTTPTATIGIRGTHFGALYCEDNCTDVATVNGRVPPNGLHLDVAQGAIEVINPGGSQLINTGEFGFVRSGMTRPLIVPPEQGVQVTMPASISQNRPKDVAGLAKGNAGNAGQCVAQ